MPKRTIPYGYRIENGVLTADTNECVVVRRIFQMRLDGWGVSAIGQQLFREQLPFFADDRNNAVKKVSAILYKGIYCGEKNYPPLVDQAAFRAVQEKKQTLPCVRQKSLAAAKDRPPIPVPDQWTYLPSLTVEQLEQDIRQCFQEPIRDIAAVRRMIFRLAAEKYRCVLPKNNGDETILPPSCPHHFR